MKEPQAFYEVDNCLYLNENHLLCGESLKILSEQMRTQSVKWIQMDAQVAGIFADAVVNGELSSIESVHYLELVGQVPEHKKEILRQHFSCPIREAYYDPAFGYIAYENREGNLQVDDANVYLEILQEGQVAEEDVIGDICLTSLYNHVTPLVRFLIGTKGTVIRDVHGNLILKYENQLMDRYVYTRDQNRIPVDLILKPVECINEKIGNIILRAQVLQNESGQVNVTMWLEHSYHGWKDEVAAMFREYVDKEISDEIQFEINVE